MYEARVVRVVVDKVTSGSHFSIVGQVAGREGKGGDGRREEGEKGKKGGEGRRECTRGEALI